MRLLLCSLFVAAAVAAPLAAQTPAGELPLAQPRQALSIGPLGAIFGVYSGEYERRLTPTVTGVIGLGYWSSGDLFSDDADTDVGISILTTDLKARFYPNARALQGFSIGGILGMTTFTGDVREGTESTSESVRAVGFGVDLNYSWLMGARENFYVGAGLGAKRMFFLTEDASVSAYWPTGRLAVGIAF
jgi:hypothetical protein